MLLTILGAMIILCLIACVIPVLLVLLALLAVAWGAVWALFALIGAATLHVAILVVLAASVAWALRGRGAAPPPLPAGPRPR